MSFKLTDAARSVLMGYGLSEVQVQYVEHTEATWRALNRKPRFKSQSALLREQARRVERLERKMRRA